MYRLKNEVGGRGREGGDVGGQSRGQRGDGWRLCETMGMRKGGIGGGVDKAREGEGGGKGRGAGRCAGASHTHVRGSPATSLTSLTS